MVTPVKFTREVRFEAPASDLHRAYIVLIVRARDGAVSLRVALDKEREAGTTVKPHEGWSLNSHMKRKTVDWWLDSEKCDVLEQGYCFGSVGYLAAQEAWAAFLADENEGWKFLEDTYNEWRKPDVTT